MTGEVPTTPFLEELIRKRSMTVGTRYGRTFDDNSASIAWIGANWSSKDGHAHVLYAHMRDPHGRSETRD